jgi:small-conductance mechanosensitive channel
VPDLSKQPWAGIGDFLRHDGFVVLQAILIILVAFVAIRLARLFVHGIVKALMDREASEGTAQELSAVELKKRMDTLDGLGVAVLRFFIVMIAAVTLLSSFGIDIGPAVAGLGIVGVALGFGAQHLVKDYLNGALILIENQFSKGDVVRIAGVAGTVEDFSLRRTTLRDLDGNVHTVPNGEIAVASNLTRVWARVNEDVTVGYGTDLDQVAEIVRNVGREMMADREWRRKILEAPHVERVDALGDSGIKVKILATVRAPERWAVAGELRKRLVVAFARQGVEIPFPHRVILNRRPGESSEGADDGADAATTHDAAAAADQAAAD